MTAHAQEFAANKPIDPGSVTILRQHTEGDMTVLLCVDYLGRGSMEIRLGEAVLGRSQAIFPELACLAEILRALDPETADRRYTDACKAIRQVF